MGGIKNRDAKRAQAKVFTSGGGGGSKGPAKLDKRNQEVKCPHCDKTYKQASRLQDHITKHHAEDAEEGAAGPGPQATAAPAAPTAGATTKRIVMDVGSRGGYYDTKSPKLMLHEWCLKEKVPKPRYKALAGPRPGTFRARVILPNPKKAELDRILILPDSEAAPTEDEALQRVAVMGLHALAGDRSMDALLSGDDREMWRRLTERAAKAKAKEAAAIERREKAAARHKAASARAARGPGAKVVMTETHRMLVADALSTLQLDALTEPSRPNGLDERESTMDAGSAAFLIGLGFAESDAQEAVGALGSGATNHALLDWLCRNLPEQALPKRFAPGASGKAPEVLLGLYGNRVHSSGSLASGAAPDPALDDPAVASLVAYGFPVPDAVAALESAKGGIRTAHGLLFSQLCREDDASQGGGDSERGSGLGPDTDGGENEDSALWEEEVEALRAIFGDDAVTSGREDAENAAVTIRLPCEQPSGDGNPVEIELDLFQRGWSKQSPRNRAYPLQTPLIAVRCEELKAATRLALTKRLHDVACQLRGQPMLFELCQAISPEELESAEADASATGSNRRGAAEEGAGPASAAPNRRRKTGRSKGPRQRTASAAEIRERSAALRESLLAWEKRDDMRQMRATRAALPAAGARESVVGGLAARRVMVIEGATGCGKSTQVPQFILEDAIRRGEGGAINIVCTQPRRVSATGLASRVAAERGEPVGATVGYAVRLESKRSDATRLLFCTTGILLRRMLHDPTLEGCSHVVLDEVHERSIESDLLLLLLKRLLISDANPTLRVVLMSATADAELFEGYFEAGLRSPVTHVAIPGFTHPVRELYLEDALELTGVVVGKSSPYARSDAAKRSDDRPASTGADSRYSEATMASLAAVDDAKINYDLIAAVVDHACRGELARAPEDARAILVFVSGVEEIDKTIRALRSLPTRARPPLHPLPLHGGLSAADQGLVFRRSPQGAVKVVVATNVAETSITIDDVSCVIDTGRVKEMAFDPDAGLNRMAETWVSQAAARQRRGRAGRVRPGTCYRLFTRKRWEKLAPNTTPEIHRVSLQGMVLDIKGILGEDADICEAAVAMLTPPKPAALHQALDLLVDIGALTRTGPPQQPSVHPHRDCISSRNGSASFELTALGRHLTCLPCDAALGKLLIYGCLLQCLDPVLTIAAALMHNRPIFLSPPASRAEADAARRRLTAIVAGSQSDHLDVIAAFSAWRGASSKASFCREHFLSLSGLQAVAAGRRQLCGALCALGFCDEAYVRGLDGPKPLTAVAEPGDSDGQDLDAAAASARVVKAALTAGLYPNLLRVDAPAPKFQKVHGGAVEIEHAAASLRFYDRTRGRVFLHPSSCNFKAGKFASGWLVYSELTQTSKVFARSTTAVPAYSILLFAGELSVDHVAGVITAGGWAKFKAPGRIAVLVHDLRAAVAALLAHKVIDPAFDLGSSPVRAALRSLLVADGI